MNIQLLTAIALPIIAYLVGSIPFGLLIVGWVTHEDIRCVGSGNIGATNVRRCAGTAWGILALLCDLLKGMLPALIAVGLLSAATPWLAPMVVLAAVSGHMFPIYLKFKPSGKGVATALGGFIVLAPAACGLALIVFIVIVAVKRIVSLGSIAAVTLLPLLIWLTTQNPYVTTSAVVAAVLIICRHKANLGRLFQGNEPTINKQ